MTRSSTVEPVVCRSETPPRSLLPGCNRVHESATTSVSSMTVQQTRIRPQAVCRGIDDELGGGFLPIPGTVARVSASPWSTATCNESGFSTERTAQASRGHLVTAISALNVHLFVEGGSIQGENVLTNDQVRFKFDLVTDIPRLGNGCCAGPNSVDNAIRHALRSTNRRTWPRIPTTKSAIMCWSPRRRYQRSAQRSMRTGRRCSTEPL